LSTAQSKVLSLPLFHFHFHLERQKEKKRRLGLELMRTSLFGYHRGVKSTFFSLQLRVISMFHNFTVFQHHNVIRVFHCVPPFSFKEDEKGEKEERGQERERRVEGEEKTYYVR
jgi:hypothetical protein